MTRRSPQRPVQTQPDPACSNPEPRNRPGQPTIDEESDLSQAAKVFLRQIDLFSRHVIGIPLYDYQLQPIEAVLDSILYQKGHEFLFIFPRQSGKNEAVAHLLVYLLNMMRRVGGNIVFGAIGDGVGRGLRRLEQRLENRWNAGDWQKAAGPLRRLLGKAAVVFLSSHPRAHARGETAHWLLVVDELQDNDPSHLQAVFQPMRAANDATALYIGTVRMRSDALWQKKLQLERRQGQDGIKRVWQVSPETVGEENPAYRRFLQAQVQALGKEHPIIQSEYYLQPIDAEGGLFPRRRARLMRGQHPRATEPPPSVPEAKPTIIVATLDVAGQDEATTDPVAQLEHPARDYTLATVFALERKPGEAAPTYKALDVFVDQGSRHFQPSVSGGLSPGQPSLVQRLAAYFRSWRVRHIVADATGVGEGVSDWLAGEFGAGHVTAYKFTPRSKAALGSRFITVIESGRFHYWTGDEEIPLSDGWWFWQQAAQCQYIVPPGKAFDTHLQWSVPTSAKVSAPAGPQAVHDDRLISAALVAVYDELHAAGTLRTGSAQSAVIKPKDPLEDLSF